MISDVSLYPKLNNCSLKKTEHPILYNFLDDELFELDKEAFELLKCCTGRNPLKEILKGCPGRTSGGMEILDYLFKEGCIVDERDDNAPNRFQVKDNKTPSLRYLQLHITGNCNLNCLHCYLGEKENVDMELKAAKKVIEEFGEIGWKLLLTGGEPLLNKNFWEILDFASQFPIRIELLTNGTLITKEIATRLEGKVHVVQISLDGLEAGHDMLRGKGCFKMATRGIKNAVRYMPVSVATIIHAGNLGEFEKLGKFLEGLGVSEWSLDIPTPTGNMAENLALLPEMDEAVRIYKRYGFTSGVHQGDEDLSCGSHICSINVHGDVTKCGFFSTPVGNIRSSTLMDCWRRITRDYIPKLEELECRECKYLLECRGGCRYRASLDTGFLGNDPFLCRIYER